jgi:hypothetical protein
MSERSKEPGSSAFASLCKGVVYSGLERGMGSNPILVNLLTDPIDLIFDYSSFDIIYFLDRIPIFHESVYNVDMIFVVPNQFDGGLYQTGSCIQKLQLNYCYY